MLPVILEQYGLSANADNESGSVSLEGMLRKIFTQHVAEDYKDKVAALETARDPVKTSSLDTLRQLQVQAAEYNIRISLYSALAKKSVTAVDTLIRA